MKLISFIFIISTGAGLMACSSFYYTSSEFDRYTVKGNSDVEMDSLVAPYRRELSKEMNRVIGTAMADLSVARPNSTLGQWSADQLLSYGKNNLVPFTDKDLPVIALLNFGGLRASVAAGPVTVGDVYKVMPFDNLLVALKLPLAKLEEIKKYLQQTGGEPIAGFTVKGDDLQLTDSLGESGYFWIITTDFLANGGDKMYFFGAPAERIDSAKLMRDLIMERIIAEQTVDVKLEERIRL